MSSWRKVKGLFWQAGAPQGDEAEELTDAEFKELLATDHALPEGPVQAADPSTVAMASSGGTVSIDFQTDYDNAGIPNTDEVEQLERFLGGLDQNLPQASKLAASKAFLGAVGKNVDDVLRDAERKIERVRAVRAGQDQAIHAALAEQQAAIEDLSATIERHKARIQELTAEMEGYRRACLLEESRLQAARVFFGNAGAQGQGG